MTTLYGVDLALHLHALAEAAYRAHTANCQRCKANAPRWPAEYACREERRLYAAADKAEAYAISLGAEL